MKQLISFVVLAFIFSCCDEDTIEKDTPMGEKFAIRFTHDKVPFTGALEVFPCVGHSVTYFGNYFRNSLSAINPSYVIIEGKLAGTARPVDVPEGEYFMVYWGINKDYPVYEGVSRSGPLVLGMDMDTAYWSLDANNDNTYKPAYNQVYATREGKYPFENVEVELINVVAALQILVRNQDGSPFSDKIIGMDVYVDNISKRLNYISGDADFSAGTVTVKFPLVITDDRMEAANYRVLLYPSLDRSKVLVRLKFTDGSTQSYSKVLDNEFIANQVQTIVFSII